MPNSPDFLADKAIFIEKVREAICSGSGMNPLVGSGASAASGIIMGLEFSDYLAYVVQLTTKTNDAWDLRMNDWPDYPKTEEYGRVRDWTLKEFKTYYNPSTGIDVTDDGKMITRIQPQLNSLSDHLNCPDPPANIRSSHFVAFDPSLSQLNSVLRRPNQRSDRYEPLWLRPEQSPTSPSWIREVGIRSLSDWRATLRFLSRLKKERSGRVVLSKPLRSVIDRFNTFITSDRQPNLAHKMLAALARPLRMRTVLTTNFDTLLEEAFLQSGHFLKKYFVSRYGQLPDPFLVRAQPSVIKLHGELLETRADFSLDGDPTPFDRTRFFRYFVDTKPGSETFQSMLSHVLVLGYSGNDIRTIRMLQHLLDETAHFQPENQPKIYWVCVSDGDVWRVNTFFKRYPKDRIIACQTDRPDLLLLEMYQKIVRAIPVAGQTYEYNHNVPPTSCKTKMGTDSQEVHTLGRDAFNRIDEKDERSVIAARDGLASVAGDMLHRRFCGIPTISVPKHPLYEHFRIRDLDDLLKGLRGRKTSGSYVFWRSVRKKSVPAKRVLFFDTACGALEALSFLYSRLTRVDGKRCLWFELADYINGDALLRDVLRSIAIRTGRFQREHVTLHPLDTAIAGSVGTGDSMKAAADNLTLYLTRLCEIVNLTPGDWPVLIYGRDLPGSCVDWHSTPWRRKTWNELFVVIGALAKAGFPVLLAHSTVTRNDGEQQKWENARMWAASSTSGKQHPQSTYLSTAIRFVDSEPPRLFTTDAARDTRLSIFDSMRNRIFQRCIDDSGFRRFVYAACLFRQSRRPSALFYEAVQPCGNRFNRNGIDNDIRRAKRAEEAIRELEDARVFYVKAGGSSWMHRDIRVVLRMMLDSIPLTNKSGRNPVESWHSHSVGRVNYWIGDWYEKAFLSTGFSKPLFEALHHYFQSARLSRYAVPKGMVDGLSQPLASHRFLQMRSSLNAMTKLLLIGRPYLKLWMANLHGFPMFSPSVRMTGESDFNHMSRWLWPETPSALRSLGMTNEQRIELGGCFQLLLEVIRDTQRAIQNEADIQISPDMASVSLMIVTSGDEVQCGLETLVDNVYGESAEWRKACSNLVKIVSSRFSAQTSQLARAYRMCLPIGDRAAFIEEHRHAENKGQVVSSLGPTFESLPALIALIESIAYAQMRRAKFCGHTVAMKDQEQAWRRTDVRDEWLRVTRICNLGIDWCKHLHPASLKLDLELRLRLHSFYAVALANLDRFHEAHRHLTEALAIQSKHLWASPRVELAKLSLRRAEVILTEAHRVGHVLKVFAKRVATTKPTTAELIKLLEGNGMYASIPDPVGPSKNQLYDVELHQSIRECLVVGNNCADIVIEKLRRLLAAMLDDAWFSIENAEKALAGHSQSSLWWGRVALMKLRACGYQLNLWIQSPESASSGQAVKEATFRDPELKMLAYSHRRITPQGMWRLFEAARLNDRRSALNMKYREFRLVRYIAGCLRVFSHCKDETDFVSSKAKELGRLYLDPHFLRKEGLSLSPELKNLFVFTKEAVRQAVNDTKGS